MFFAEYLMGTCKDSKKISFYKAISIGLFQSLALFPGFSRSGSTISGGVLLGLSKESAARFSFLLSLPIILSAGIYQLLSINFSEFVNLELLFGLVSSFLSGLFAIRFLLGFLKSNKLYPFIIYRILLVLFLLLYKIY
jgi:undecaprenyl-diphosphatase